ncbi:MAG: HIT domain-containing protein [Sandaracinaceae bacterium]|nr:HIT domain-containing protein [Sandaracinaceae bacterium]
MVRRVDRDTALARIDADASEGCVPCALARARDPLMASTHAVATLSRFPVRWGHVLVVFREHWVTLEEVSPAAWADATALAHAAGRAVERALTPARCYVASLGTSEPDLPMTFPHLHFHVIPVGEPGARPAEVLTWRDGVYEGTAEEWDALRAALLAAWP